MKKAKTKIFNIIRDDDENDTLSNIFDTIIIFFILISICGVICSTFDNISEDIIRLNSFFEVLSVAVFSIEYLLRLWTADLYYHEGTVRSRLHYVFSFMAIIDLISILPFYMPFIIKIDLRSLRTIRLIRLLRIFKLHRYTQALDSVLHVFKKKKEQLVSSIFVVIILMIISSILMYYCEHDAQPDVFENAFSGLWWAIATLTTVGYGDIYPVTFFGKIISTFLAILGIGLVAVPTGIISAGFSEELEENKGMKDEINYCPHCGHKLK